MKKPEELSRLLTEMYKETKEGKLRWSLQVQTTEHNKPEEKPVEEEDGISWTVDECYVSYVCNYKGQDFCMITYEMLHTAADKVKTTNLIFLPPLGIRYFDLHTLLPYAVESSSMLPSQIREFWTLVLEMQRNNPESLSFDVSERVLTIED